MGQLKRKSLFILLISVFAAFSFAEPAEARGPEKSQESSPGSMEGQGMHNSQSSQSKNPPPSPVSPPPAPPQKPEGPEGNKEKNPQNFVHYRGNRTFVQQEKLVLLQVKSSRVDEDEVVMEISFNQSLNPRSVKSSSIILDDEELPEKVKFSFNRKGDTIRVQVPSKDDEIKVKIQGVRAFSGVLIEPVEILSHVE
ncbi:MAG: hypothetical protein IJ688_12290 [Treponema sp.]|nr:hypothetical protein [Treponema sp.]